MSILDNLPHECSVLKRKYSKGSQGGKKWKYEIVATDVKCWEQGTGASETADYQKKGMTVSRKIYFMSNPNVSMRHRLVVTKRNGVVVPEAGQVELEITGAPIPDASVGKEVIWKVMVKELTAEDD